MSDIRSATNAITAVAADGVADEEINRVTAAVDVLDRSVAILGGQTVGNAAATVNPALRSIGTAYADLSAAACQ